MAFVVLEAIRNRTQCVFTHNYTILHAFLIQSFKEDDEKSCKWCAPVHMDPLKKLSLQRFSSLLKLAEVHKSML